MGMHIVTINVPDQYLDKIQSMIDKKEYPSRSEAIRQAIVYFLKKEPTFTGDLACVS